MIYTFENLTDFWDSFATMQRVHLRNGEFSQALDDIDSMVKLLGDYRGKVATVATQIKNKEELKNGRFRNRCRGKTAKEKGGRFGGKK